MSYEKRGVSADKSEVHKAIKNLDKGIFPNAFCKILPDLAAGDPDYCNIMHADTAGTKTSLAYLYWKETGDLSVWKGIVQDALVMNFDDMACAGAVEKFVVSSTIGRNKNLIPGEVLTHLINGAMEFIDKLKSMGFNIDHAGGETADVGDIVRTADVGFTVFSRLPQKDVLQIKIKPGDVILGLASYGKASYETEYNSGIGSNGLTFARHEMLNHTYATKYPESFDPNIEDQYVYTGKMKLTDPVPGQPHSIGKLLLSPTRTYLPFIKSALEAFRPQIHGMVHNTGGGQTKVLHFIEDLHIVKDSVIEIPPVFQVIQQQRNTPWQEMYKVFNMGQRLEIYTDQVTAGELIKIADQFQIHAQVVGRVKEGKGKKVTITAQGEEMNFS